MAFVFESQAKLYYRVNFTERLWENIYTLLREWF
jgi:hypothetical protein